MILYLWLRTKIKRFVAIYDTPNLVHALKFRSPSTGDDTLVAFVDDRTLGPAVRTEPDNHFKVIVLFSIVILWFGANCLALNVTKLSFLIF